MDSLSSDEEYFDTVCNLVENPVIEQIHNRIDTNSKNAQGDQESNFCNELNNCTIKSDSEDLFKENLHLIEDDSSDSESLVDELIKCDSVNSEAKEENISNDFKNKSENEVEKSIEESQFEERVKLESLLSIEELENLRKNSLIIKDQGNSCFKLQSYDEAIKLYTNAIYTCPLQFKEDHAIFHFNRGTTLAKIDKNDDAIKNFSTALTLNPGYLKALLKRAELLEKTDKLSEALEDYKEILKLDPHNWSALHAQQVLPEKIRVQQEKLKEEMFGQLKQLGNLVLKPFGLSTDNFKMVQDPVTGSYSVNFQNK